MPPTSEKGRPDPFSPKACAHLGEYTIVCPSPRACAYVAVVAAGTCIAVGHDMDRISVRLPELLAERAVRCGAEPETELGPAWVTFQLFRPDWPDPDLPFWLLKAYAAARR